MRYLGDGRPVYTATDLCDYLACGHLVTLKRRVAKGEVIPADRSALSEVLATLGAGSRAEPSRDPAREGPDRQGVRGRP